MRFLKKLYDIRDMVAKEPEVKRLSLKNLALTNPRTFELIYGKYGRAGSARIWVLEESAIAG